MLCDECKSNQASVHLVSIVNGEKKERNLCPQCAHKLGADSFSPFSWSDMFPGSFGGFARPKEAQCPACGMTLSEFERRGLLGCPQCYQSLREGLLPVIGRVQTRAQHSGRSPQNYQPAKLAEPSEKNMAEEEKLQSQLQRAIAAEEYEKAADLRDQIRALKERGEQK